jgi:uncharacterized protein YkwD
MVKGWTLSFTKGCDESPQKQKKQLSMPKLRLKSCQPQNLVSECQDSVPHRQLALRKLTVESNTLYQGKEEIDHHNCWEYLGKSSRNLMETKSDVRPGHTRNNSDETTTSTLSAISIDSSRLQAAMEFGKVITRNRMLPTVVPGFISGNHMLVNKERIIRHLPALRRRVELDQLAKERAEIMAKAGRVRRGDRKYMLSRLSPCTSYAENVACGTSIIEIHNKMLTIDSDVNNMIDKCHTEFGMGTSKARNQKIYLCQIFKG